MKEVHVLDGGLCQMIIGMPGFLHSHAMHSEVSLAPLLRNRRLELCQVKWPIQLDSVKPGCHMVSAGSQMSKAMKSCYHDFCNGLSEAGCQKYLGKTHSLASVLSMRLVLITFFSVYKKLLLRTLFQVSLASPSRSFPSVPGSSLHHHYIFSPVNAS